jgi:hypothetical protein
MNRIKRVSFSTDTLNGGNMRNATADAGRAQADWHDRKAAQLKSGDHKDAHIIAAKKYRDAADLSDAAYRAEAKANIFESAVSHGESAPQLVRQLQAMEFTESEIAQLTKDGKRPF